MDVTILASATDDKLADLADVKDALDITDGGKDMILDRMIRRASRRIESFCGRSLLLQTYRAVLPGYGRMHLRLPAYPVRAILKVFDGTDTGSAAELRSTEYRLDREAGILHRDEGFPWTYQAVPDVITWPEAGQERPNWLVEFSAGYIPIKGKDSTADGTTSTGMTLEPDIQEACIGLVRSLWHNRGRAENIKSKSVGDLSISYGAQAGELPDEVQAILTPYRSIR